MQEIKESDQNLILELIKSSKDPIFVLDQNHQLLSANSSAEKILTFNSSSFFNSPLEKLFTSLNLEPPISDTPPRLNKKSTLLSRKNIYLQWQLTALSDGKHYLLHGKPAPGYRILTDLISADFLNQLEPHIYWKNLESVYYGANKVMLDSIEKTSVLDLSGKKDEDFFWRDSAFAFQRIDDDVMKNEKPVVTKEIAKQKDENNATFLSAKSPLYNELNELIGMIGISTPYVETRSKLKNEELSSGELEAYLEQVISLIPGSVYWKDLNGRYMGCNETFRNMAGLVHRDQIVGKTDMDLWNEEQAERLVETDLMVLETKKPLTVEEFGYLADGTYSIYLSTKTPLYYPENKIIGIVGISIDITELKENQNTLASEKEKAELANKVKTEFLASMSHDLRTPLNAILGFSEILQIKKNLPQNDIQDYIKSIQDAANILFNLIEGILDFVKIEAGQFKMVSEPVDLLTMIEEIKLMLNLEAEKKGVQLITHYEEDIPRYIISDPHRLRRIITNLLNNAIKFTDDGHIIISVECLARKKQNAELQINIEDTGIGIPADKISGIFERFNRGEPSYASRYAGTGLGLTIVKELVESLEGYIKVNSQVERGSTFSINIPVKLQKNSVRPSIWIKYFSDIHILIVDNHPTRGFYLQRQLGTKNVEVVKIEQAKDILKHSKKPYNITIVDDEIDHEHLIELGQWIRQDKNLKNMLPLCLARQSQISLSQEILAAGYAGTLSKPIKISTFSQEMLQHWSQWVSKTNENDVIQMIHPEVLLVEDDPASAKVALILLKDAGCTVTAAKTAEEAISKLDRHFDIAFIDIGLPDMQGTEVIKKAREILGNKLPIVTLSAHSSEADKNLFIAKGANATLQKPLSQEALKNMLLHFLVND